MVEEYGIVTAIIDEQFRRFREDHVLRFANSDEELDKAAEYLGVRSLEDLRFVVALHVFTRNIEQSAKYN